MSSNIERFIERRLGELTDENAKLRQAIESIQRTLKQGFGDQFMLNRIAGLVAEALATPGEGGGA